MYALAMSHKIPFGMFYQLTPMTLNSHKKSNHIKSKQQYHTHGHALSLYMSTAVIWAYAITAVLI